jgi:septum formation protein
MPEPIAAPPLILASSSPRRRELLRQRGYHFEIVEPDIDERPGPGESPPVLAQRLALAKARVASRRAPHGAVVLGCDTIVVLGERVLNKPEDATHAVEMLLEIAGRTHTVLTAFAAVAPAMAREEIGVEASRVTLRGVERSEALAYAASGEPLDKAGAYALQGEGARFVTRVEGSRSNVIGLPLERVEPVLRALGVVPA